MSSAGASGKSKSRRWIVVFAIVAIAAGSAAFGMRSRLMRTRTKAAAVETSKIELIHLDTFVVNLADDEHTFLRIGIDLGVLHAKEAANEEKSKSPEISIARDAILTRLSTSSSGDLSTTDGRQKLKSDLLSALNFRVPQMQVQEIYITEFLIQR